MTKLQSFVTLVVWKRLAGDNYGGISSGEIQVRMQLAIQVIKRDLLLNPCLHRQTGNKQATPT
jgi:hypothetical protein